MSTTESDKLQAIKADILRRRQLINCPACDSHIAYRMNYVVDGVMEAGALAEKTLQRKPDWEIRPFKDDSPTKLSEAILCPCCDGYFQIEFDLVVRGVRKVEKSHLPARHEREEAAKRPPDEWAEAVEQFGLDDLMDAFAAALRARRDATPPNYPRRYLATFLKCALPVRLSVHHARLLRGWGDGAGFVEVYQFQKIGMVVIDGEIRGFVPYDHFRGESRADDEQGWIKVSPRFGQRDTQVSPPRVRKQDNLEVWIKTRNGYVVRRGLMFDELKGKRPGDFAKATGNY